MFLFSMLIFFYQCGNKNIHLTQSRKAINTPKPQHHVYFVSCRVIGCWHQAATIQHLFNSFHLLHFILIEWHVYTYQLGRVIAGWPICMCLIDRVSALISFSSVSLCWWKIPRMRIIWIQQPFCQTRAHITSMTVLCFNCVHSAARQLFKLYCKLCIGLFQPQTNAIVASLVCNV